MEQNVNIDELINKQNKMNYILDAINENSEKYNALPEKLKKILEPYRNKLNNGLYLSEDDYEKIKEQI